MPKNVHPKVFISYSHDSPEHAARVLAFADALGNDGIDVILDQYNPVPREGWPFWMQTNLDAADFVLMVCTETYHRRVMRREKPHTGLGVQWEGNLIYNRLYQNTSQGHKYLPVLFHASEVQFIPEPLQGFTRYTIKDFTLVDGQYQALYRHLTDQLATPKRPLGSIKLLPSVNRLGSTPTSTPSSDNQTPSTATVSSVPANTPSKTAPKVFVSYSHKDAKWLEEFKIHLAPYIRNAVLDEWDDRKIVPGKDRKQAILEAIKAADIAVLLVTPNFLASDFIVKEKLPDLLERQVVFWIAVTSSAYEIMPIANYEAANNPERPLSGLTKARRDAEWVTICKKLVAAMPHPK